MPGLSRTRVQELIVSGLVKSMANAAKKGSFHLRGGEKITLENHRAPAHPRRSRIDPARRPLRRRRRHRINKPAGMTVHAGAGAISGTLVNALSAVASPFRNPAIHCAPASFTAWTRKLPA